MPRKGGYSRLGRPESPGALPEPLDQPPPLDAATLSRLAGGLAHELKNPLSTIAIHLALLRELWEEEQGAVARRSLHTLGLVQQEVQRLDEILEDFLRYARTDTLELAPVDLAAVARQVVDFVAPECAARDIRIQLFQEDGLPAVLADARRIRQALLNLMINARQAIGREGEIHVLLRRDGEGVILEVVDDGPGMDAETLARCLDVYFSSKKNGGGLGLPTVQRVVEAHGGRFTVESEPGHGTRARIQLPLTGPGGGGGAAAAGE